MEMRDRIRNLVKLREPIMESETQQRPPLRQFKKKARRRLYASKPYQERLLNMAEARKEIAAALRFHRIAMKHQQNQTSQEPPPPPQPVTTPIYYSRNICKHPFPCSSSPRPRPLTNHPLCPKSNMETVPTTSAETCLSRAAESRRLDTVETPTLDSTLHPVMGDEEMAEIRSIGERHDWEWNDRVNLLTSAWWSRFLETMDGKGEAFRALGEAMDNPTWLSGGSGMDHLMDDHLHGVSFPWL
ncbi:hypothetical protein HPP92_013274 [Vanilla planifolia]|nr:hypothetical protein HPP92_013274 [Vanilla planifolia]